MNSEQSISPFIRGCGLALVAGGALDILINLTFLGGHLDPAIRVHLKSGQRIEHAEVIAASLSTSRNVGP